ncbi:MAG: EAL domain-containing protein [Phormidesmis sp.]
MQDTGLNGRYLKLEITESVFIENAKEAASILSELKQLNVQICLDDFGTGYSSLSYLHQFPIDIVKIDRSFIYDMEIDVEKLEIVRAIVGLCHTLGIAVTAEGIETPQQRDILQDLGCEYGQGHLFARATDGTTITCGLIDFGLG